MPIETLMACLGMKFSSWRTRVENFTTTGCVLYRGESLIHFEGRPRMFNTESVIELVITDRRCATNSPITKDVSYFQDRISRDLVNNECFEGIFLVAQRCKRLGTLLICIMTYQLLQLCGICCEWSPLSSCFCKTTQISYSICPYCDRIIIIKDATWMVNKDIYASGIPKNLAFVISMLSSLKLRLRNVHFWCISSQVHRCRGLHVHGT